MLDSYECPTSIVCFCLLLFFVYLPTLKHLVCLCAFEEIWSAFEAYLADDERKWNWACVCVCPSVSDST